MGLLDSAHIAHVFIVLHPELDRVLVLRGARGPEGELALPSFVAEERHPADAIYLNREFSRMTGIDGYVLGSIASVPSRMRVYAMEARRGAAEHGRSAAGTPAWVVPAALEEVHPNAAAWAASAIAPDRGRPAWTRRGFLGEAVAWVERALSDAGRGKVQSFEQVRTWEFSVVIRFRAGGRDYFFKALPEGAADEGARIERLAAEFPDALPAVIARDRSWVLLEGAIGPCLEDVADVTAWEAAARAYARLQMAFSGRCAELQLPVRSLDDLASAIDGLLEANDVLLIDTPEGLTGAEARALKGRARQFEAWCRELAVMEPVLRTLDHGDLWASNVLVTERGPVFIDWTDAVECHPFVGMFLLLEGAFLEKQLKGGADDAKRRIARAYLAPFAERYDAAALHRAFDAAQRIAPLFHAWRFHRDVLPTLRTPEMVELVPFFLRRLLTGTRSSPG